MTLREQTLTSVKIYLGFNKQCLATGTAFVYERDRERYLVTNWHNVTGKNSLTHKCLDKNLGIPNKIVAVYPVYHSGDIDSQQAVFAWQTLEVHLYDADGVPSWYEHPEHGSLVDLAAIPMLPLSSNSAVLCVNDARVTFANQAVGAGTDAFILGYPHGLSGGGKFPIWKRGSIASEPQANVDRLPKMLIDASTRRGMSGSPVFAHVEGLSSPVGSSDLGAAVFGSTFQFMGCYSGSLGREPFEAQLGVMWKEEAIVEIIDSKHKGRPSGELFERDVPSGTTHEIFDWNDWGNLPELP
ncbi:TPA: trypsin-like peptidase domain-containing protein [Burkholderia vietnamiensis]|nr:trypsin-like peptidase domain-containing protein [Burkholderia vietnamiensis]